MITNIYIDGVRTLSDFSMSLRQGLNVLVGPNGAGKTNILVALDFIASLAEVSVSRAFSRHGGIASIATWPSASGRFKPMTFEVGGYFEVGKHAGGGHSHPKPPRDVTIRYDYRVGITFDALDIARITSERLAFFILPRRGSPRRVLDVRRTKKAFELRHLDLSPLKGLEWIPSRAAFLNAMRRRGAMGGGHGLIPSLEQLSYLIHLMTHEFEHLERVNILPDFLRGGDPVGIHPSIQPSGRGLVRTLSSLHDGSGRTNSSLSPKAAYKRILNRLKIGVEGVQGLSFHRDLETGRYLAQATISQGKQSVRKLPLGRLSDGTLKWLTLLTQIETSDLFAVEEPENFLHPAMQREVVRFLREFASNSRAVLVSTHSETVISAIEPEELIVVRDVRGRTVASRLRDPQMVLDALNETGFGLGHIYLSGDLFDPASLVSAGSRS